MSLLCLVPSLELSPTGDDEFGPSTKDGMPRKITQKLPRWAGRLPLLEVSRLHLLGIKVSSWNGSGPAGRRPPPPGHVPSGALLSHPPAPSPLPLGPLPQAPGGSALPSSTAGLPSVPSRHLRPFFFLFSRRQGTTSQLTRAPCLHKLTKKRRAQKLDPHSLSSNPCSVLPGREVLGRPLTFSGTGGSEGAQMHSVTGGTEELKLFVDSVGGGGGKLKMRAVCRLGEKKHKMRAVS